MESRDMELLDPKEMIEITTAFVTDDDGNAVLVKKRRRRVSFARTQTIHLIPRDDEFETPPEPMTAPISPNVFKHPPRKSPRPLARARASADPPALFVANSPPSKIHHERTETGDALSDMDTSESQGSCRVDGIGSERESLDPLEADSIGPVHLWHISHDGEDNSFMNDDVTMDAATFSLHLSRVLDSSTEERTFDVHEEEATGPVINSTPYKFVDERTGQDEESTPYKFVNEGTGPVEKFSPSNEGTGPVKKFTPSKFAYDSEKEIDGMSFTQFCEPNWSMPKFDKESSYGDGNTSDMSLATQFQTVRWLEKEKPSPATSSSLFLSPVAQRSPWQAAHEDKENLPPQKVESGGFASIFGLDAKGLSAKSLAVQGVPTNTIRKQDSALKPLQNLSNCASSPTNSSVKPSQQPHASLVSVEGTLQLRKCEGLTDVFQNGGGEVTAALFPSKLQNSADCLRFSSLDHQQENLVEKEICHASELLARRQQHYQNACARLSSTKEKSNVLQRKLDALGCNCKSKFQLVDDALEKDALIQKLEAEVRKTSLANSLLYQQQLMHIKLIRNAEGTSQTDFSLDGMYYQRIEHIKGGSFNQLKFSRWLDLQAIDRAFPCTDAYLAFQYAVNIIQDSSSIQVKKIQQLIQHTNWLMGSLVDLLKEVKYCSSRFRLSSKFLSSHDGELQLRLTFFGSYVELKIILIFSMSCMKGQSYPKGLTPVDIQVKYVDNPASVVQDINTNIGLLKPGFGRLKNICNSVQTLMEKLEEH